VFLKNMGVSTHTVSIAEILGLGDEVRTQNPKLQTAGTRFYIRPYVDRLIDGRRTRVQERIYLTATTKREALAEKARIMATINQSRYVLQSQMSFGDFLEHYEREYVDRGDNLGAGTRSRYKNQIKNHVRPAFGALPMARVTTKAMDEWLAQKARDGMAWSGRMSLRNLMAGIFTQARKWGWWQEQNPALDVTVGKQRAVRVPVKLTTEQTRALLASLPEDVRMICEVALYCTCRISEVLGLQWQDIDFQAGIMHIRRRWYRGDLDEVKSLKSRRSVPLGIMADELRARYPEGAQSEFVFEVKTHVGRWKTPGACRDDRDINQHFLRPAAKALGVYQLGFGFHAFRREAVTEHAREAGSAQAQKMAGHSKADMTQHYVLVDFPEQLRSVVALQRKIRGVQQVSQNEPAVRRAG
jgi:integrase